MTNPETPERITTFEQAHRVGAYELARRWADRSLLPMLMPREKAEAAGIPVREVADELEELAVMAALHGWLDGWMPINVHRSLLAGATVEQTATAMGTDPTTMAAAWRAWSAGQRRLWQTYPDMDHTAEHDRVAAILDSYSTPPREPGR
ncbi:MAG: hypothetical protein JWO67_1457 [Streptosporangiaceae bacterium]|nr:hypothetical protein [Streptosporangiaceae bacterium]